MALIFYDSASNFNILIIICAITLPVVLSNILFFIIASVVNNRKRKQFINIKNNGVHLRGYILMANEHFEFHKHSWLHKSSGDLTIIADNKKYKVEELDYNDKFKQLEERLISSISIHSQKIEVNIYVLDNKAVADLESINIK